MVSASLLLLESSCLWVGMVGLEYALIGVGVNSCLLIFALHSFMICCARSLAFEGHLSGR